MVQILMRLHSDQLNPLFKLQRIPKICFQVAKYLIKLILLYFVSYYSYYIKMNLGYSLFHKEQLTKYTKIHFSKYLAT